MTATVEQSITNRGVFVATLTLGKNENATIEIGHLRDVSIQARRTTGSTQDVDASISNDGTGFLVAHSKQWVTTTGDGGNVELSNLVAGAHMHDLLEHARYLKFTVDNTAGGDTDVIVVTVVGTTRN